jgi:hypothetical protein
MIINQDTTDRMHQHGYRVGDYPNLEPCAYCGLDATIRIAYEYVSGEHTLWCECCGWTSDGNADLRAVFEHWNKQQTETSMRLAMLALTMGAHADR